MKIRQTLCAKLLDEPKIQAVQAQHHRPRRHRGTLARDTGSGTTRGHWRWHWPMRGSASPKGEARRNAPPRQSEAYAAAGRTTGGGGRAV